MSYKFSGKNVVIDLLGWSPLLVWLAELVVAALRVDRSLEARAERSRGNIGSSSCSGDSEPPAGTSSRDQPNARTALHTANTNVIIAPLSWPFALWPPQETPSHHLRRSVRLDTHQWYDSLKMLKLVAILISNQVTVNIFVIFEWQKRFDSSKYTTCALWAECRRESVRLTRRERVYCASM